MSPAPKNWRELRRGLRDLGARPVRTRGSHEMWRFADGEMFLVVRNHLGRPLPRNVRAHYRRLRARQNNNKNPPSIPKTN